jgi:hypothetical protein
MYLLSLVNVFLSGDIVGWGEWGNLGNVYKSEAQEDDFLSAL